MKTLLPALAGRRWLFTLAVMTLIAGCATKVDWASRVGKYTYDQAVTELGPPDKQAKLDDGTIVADWITYRSRTQNIAVIGGYPGGYYGGPVTATTMNPPDYYLRLTFGPEGELKSWKKFSKY
jgi:hypothetical protein